MIIRDILEASGYIARNAEEAKDPRWSASLTADVHTDTMRKQLAAFYPTSAPDDGQVQVKEANKIMTDKQLNEGQGSVNVDTQLDVSRIRKLAGLANSSSAAGTPVNEDITDDLSEADAHELAAELEQYVSAMAEALQSVEMLVRQRLPRKYRQMESYTFAHIKSAIGGMGYPESYTSDSLNSLIEQLNEHQLGAEGEY